MYNTGVFKTCVLTIGHIQNPVFLKLIISKNAYLQKRKYLIIISEADHAKTIDTPKRIFLKH